MVSFWGEWRVWVSSEVYNIHQMYLPDITCTRATYRRLEAVIMYAVIRAKPAGTRSPWRAQSPMAGLGQWLFCLASRVSPLGEWYEGTTHFNKALKRLHVVLTGK